MGSSDDLTAEVFCRRRENSFYRKISQRRIAKDAKKTYNHRGHGEAQRVNQRRACFLRMQTMPNGTLSKKQREEILRALKARFEKNMSRHKGLEWSQVQTKLEANTEELFSL